MEEGILHAASEVKELLVHDVDQHLDENNNTSSTSSSSDEDEAPPADKFPRIESAVVPLNDNNIITSSSSSSSSTDEEAPAEDLILPATAVVQHSAPVAVSQAQSIDETNTNSEEATHQPHVLAKVVIIDESESSDDKVLPIEEAQKEEETLVPAPDSLPTTVLVSKETEDSPPQNIPIVESTVDEHTDKREIPETSGSPVLITTVTHRVRSPTSWMSCCGLFQVLRRDR